MRRTPLLALLALLASATLITGALAVRLDPRPLPCSPSDGAAHDARSSPLPTTTTTTI
jgi:hypothetical protein